MPKDAVKANEDLKNFVLNTLSTILDKAHKKVPINAKTAHNIDNEENSFFKFFANNNQHKNFIIQL